MVYFETIEEVAEYAAELTGKEVEADVETIEKALEVYAEGLDDDDAYYYLHEFIVVED